MSTDLWLAGGDVGDRHADIIIPVYNQAGYTRDCLRSVLAETAHPYRVTVVDNGSTDETAAVLGELSAAGLPLRVIRNERNLGFTPAVNQGLRAAAGRYAVLLNNDTVVLRGWLDGLVMTAESDERIGLVGPKILDPNTDRIHCLGGLVFYQDHVAAPPGQGCRRDDRRFAASFDCQYVEGSCVLIKRAVLDRIGYLDEAFAPAYFEDADFSFRAREAGFRLVYSPLADVYHYSMVTAQAVRREDDSLAAVAARNERLFRQRWAHRFY